MKEEHLPNNSINVMKLTTLWAFSESVLGGVLHLFSIPFSGALLTGFAVILISLIAYFSETKWDVFKSTLIVMLVKFAVSPHTPATAYIAVSLQGILGEFLFFSRKYYRQSCLLLGILTMLFTALQRLIILTIIFGNTFWNSIDVYSSSIIKQFYNYPRNEIFQLSYYLIGVYILLHLVLGIWVGYWAGKMPGWINEIKNSGNLSEINLEESKIDFPELNRNKKKWWEKKSFQFILVIILILVIISYFEPSLGKTRAAELLIMLLRSVIILVLWFTLISPAFIKFLHKIFKRKGYAYIDQVNRILNAFPRLKNIAAISWQLALKEKGVKRFRVFITTSIFLTLFK